MNLALPKIYPITDTMISGLSHLEQVRRLIAGGATLIQLRDKSAPAGEFYIAAVECIEYARRYNAKIIINDRADIALASHADGVHVGQDDLSPVRVRELLGPKAIIGFSTHSIEQARDAITQPVDYIAFGPIFSTATKLDHDPVVGLEALRSVKEVTKDVPLVAIGGIDDSNARSVLDAGADSLAIIGHLASVASETDARMRVLSKI